MVAILDILGRGHVPSAFSSSQRKCGLIEAMHRLSFFCSSTWLSDKEDGVKRQGSEEVEKEEKK